jgi:tRNA-Thr(GGU) m(6)t(6)A37 methyltransferase TsaA
MCDLTPIGTIESCFKEKFGIPRQSGLAPAARATLVLHPPYNQAAVVSGLEAFTHVWLIYLFHGVEKGKWKPTVRPPRLGGNRRTGVFATRSNFRPNPLGLSAVKLDEIITRGAQVRLELSGTDLLDGTPVLDIKPYLPYADTIDGAGGGFAQEAPGACLAVEFTADARAACDRLEADTAPGITRLIEQTLALDPRPAYKSDGDPDRIYGFKIYNVDVRWKTSAGKAIVVAIRPAS